MAIFLSAFCRASPSLAARQAVLVSRWASASFAEGFQLPPKRPPNAYILFVKEQMNESRELEPERPKELMRHIGTMWNNLSDGEKQRYKVMNETQLKQWEADYHSFIESLPDKDEYLKQLKALRGERRKQLKVYREKKQKRLTKPPRKLSAYNIYVRDQLAGATQDEIQARFTLAAQTWKALSEEEKAEYELEAKQIHEHEMEEYNSRAQAV